MCIKTPINQGKFTAAGHGFNKVQPKQQQQKEFWNIKLIFIINMIFIIYNKILPIMIIKQNPTFLLLEIK